MGYTHYWDLPGQENTDEKAWTNFLNDCKEILEHGIEAGILANWDGENALDLSNVEKDGISFNGWERPDGAAHETCEFPAFDRLGTGFTFCKTAQKPYDLYVTACLTVFHNSFGNVRSDGEAYEWAEGVALANEIGEAEFQNPITEDE